MEQATLDHFKNLFLEMKKNYLSEDCEYEFFRGSEVKLNSKGDEVDVSQADRESELVLKLKGRKKFFLRKVDVALERIFSGDFGTCMDCGDEIGVQRLYARPTATHCVTCKEGQEQQEKHILYHKKSHTVGRDLSLNNNVVNLPSHDEEDKRSANISSNILSFSRQA